MSVSSSITTGLGQTQNQNGGQQNGGQQNGGQQVMNIVDQVVSWVQSNPLMAAAIAGAALFVLWMFTQ